MNTIQSSRCCNIHSRRPIVFILFVLISYWFLFPCVEGRVMSKVAMEEKGVVMKRNLIGSAPPRCERICDGCEHCEAIQVPVTTQSGTKTRTHVPVAASYGRVDSFSNYKPISWKCKCGSVIFNP